MKYNHAFVVLGIGAALSAAHAQTASAPATPAAQTAFDQTVQDIKKPVPWFNWGADLRLRNEYFNNAQTLDENAVRHEQDYFRFRGRVWGSITPLEQEGISINGRLAAEPREFMKPSSFGSFRGQQGFEARYGIVDNANVGWKNILDTPLSAKVGRQDIALNDGWLVLDGTPNDGSWTFFLDSARLTYELKDQNTTIDAIGIIQDPQDDAWIPTINNQNALLTDQYERGAILNIANKTFQAANLDAYFIYKNDLILDAPTAPEPARSTPFADNADIYTAGARVSGLVGENVKYSAEGAYQFGEKQDPNLRHAVGGANQERDINAFGVNTRAAYLFKDKLNNQIAVSYEYLSGDDPDTQDDEMFDILWGRYPRWSELYNVYSFVLESRVGQFANLHRIGPGWSLTPAKNLDFSLSYNALFADQQTPTRSSNLSLFSQDGNFRGHYMQAWLKYKFNQYVSGHLWGECVFMGDYYTNHDLMSFLRAEVLFTF